MKRKVNAVLAWAKKIIATPHQTALTTASTVTIRGDRIVALVEEKKRIFLPTGPSFTTTPPGPGAVKKRPEETPCDSLRQDRADRH